MNAVEGNGVGNLICVHAKAIYAGLFECTYHHQIKKLQHRLEFFYLYL